MWTDMLMDFEKAAINSFQQTWPNSTAKGCFFLLTQNIWRKVQAVGLQTLYSNDQEFAISIRMIASLAFADPFEVPSLCAEVASQLPTQVDKLIEYFERTYIGRRLPGGAYQQPLFPIGIWNYHFDTVLRIPRTANAVEAWHRSFNCTVRCHYPTIWKFISALKREQRLVEVRQAKYLAGDQPVKRKGVKDDERALKNLILSYSDRPRMEFQRGVSYHSSIGSD